MVSQFLRRAGMIAGVVGSVAVGTGCYHSIITTDLPPSSEVYREPFKAAFIWGIVPAQVDASKYCEGRRWARVETQQSFLNIVVAVITANIFTPLDVRVTCAATGAMRTPDGPTIKYGVAATDEQKDQTMAVAVQLAKETGTAVYVAY